MSLPVFTESTASFYDPAPWSNSDPPIYLRRDHLSRGWGDLKKRVLFIGLNPSVAGEKRPDHTITVEVGFAMQWGFGALDKVNLFDWIDSNPKALLSAPAPAGDPRNIDTIRRQAESHETIVATWGDGGALDGRAAYVLGALWDIRERLFCLGKTKAGYPKHTSRLAYATPLVAMLRG